MSNAFVASALAATLVAMVSTPSAAQQKLTYATYATPGWNSAATDVWFMEELKKRTDGALDFETYYGGSLLKPAELIPGVGQGAADIGHSTAQYNLNLLPLSDVVQPFTTEKVDAASLALNELYQNNKDIAEEFTRNNLKFLYAVVPGEMVLYSKKPIASPDDLKGQRIRALTGSGYAINRLGGTAVAVPWTEAMDVFQRGGLDGVSNITFDISVVAGTHEVAPYVSDLGGAGVYSSMATFMNLDTYNGLAPEVRAIVDELAAEAPTKFLEITDRIVGEAVDRMAATESITVLLTPDEHRPTYQAIAEELRGRWIADLEAKGQPGRAVMEEFIGYVRAREAGSDWRIGLQRVIDKRGDD